MKTSEVKTMSAKPSNEMPQFFADRLTARGYSSLWDFAKKENLPYTTVTKYAGREGDKAFKSLLAAKRLADALGVTLDELVAGLLSEQSTVDKAS